LTSESSITITAPLRRFPVFPYSTRRQFTGLPSSYGSVSLLTRCDGPLCYSCLTLELRYIRWYANKAIGISQHHHRAIKEMLVAKPYDILAKGPTLDTSYSEQQAADASVIIDPPEHSHSKRDPHDLPDFSDPNPPTSPVLFLPPRLFTLSYDLPHTLEASPDQPPPPTSSDLDPASLSLHRALHHFSPITPYYATQPYAESFNWASLVLPEDQEREWYAVVFKSKRRPGSDSGSAFKFIPDQGQQMLTKFLELFEADRRAHEEAIQNGGVRLLSRLPG
jgi:hypothetical protein